MARKELDKNRRGYQGLFLALTLVVIITIVLTVPNLTVAVVVIGHITNFLIISSQLTFLGDRLAISHKKDHDQILARIHHDLGSSPLSGDRDVVCCRATPSGAETAALETEPFGFLSHGSPGRGYPGAIDFGAADPPGDTDEALAHTGWTADDEAGNPYGSGWAALPCVGSDAAVSCDGDELNAYQVRSRNSPERVWAGVYRRKSLIDRYVREELDERENAQWWGAHEA